MKQRPTGDQRTPPIKYVSPPGIALFPSTREGDKYGNMGMRIRFEADAFQTILEDLVPVKDRGQGAEAFAAKHGFQPVGLQCVHATALESAREEFAALKPAARKKLGDITINEIGSPVFDDNENETGQRDINFRLKASGVNRNNESWERKPLLVMDGKGKPVYNLGTGSLVQVSFLVNPDGYFIPATGAAGIALRPLAFRVIELVPHGGSGARTPEAFGFEVDEDAYSVEDDPSAPTAPPEAATRTDPGHEAQQGDVAADF